MRRILARAVLATAIALVTAWTALALRLGPLDTDFGAAAFAAIGAAAVLSVFVPRLRRPVLPGFGAALGLFAIAWTTVLPSNDRDWQVDVAVLPYATFEGDRVTIHNVRSFEYRTETDFTPRWEDRTYQLADLDSADIVVSYWAGDAIAHVMMSFGFAEKDYLAISIETRKEAREEYSTVAGFFRRYELYYVAADERDLIRLRTNVRQNPPESVYVFRTNAPRENVRRIFLDYLASMNSLAKAPEFYNTLTTNCTTAVLAHTRVNPGRQRYNWKILLSGYAPLYAYEMGRLDGSLRFEELKRRSRVNDAARAADDAADFSRRIRAGVPRPKPSSS